MKMTADFSDDLKPEELGELVDIAREQQRSVGLVIMEAVRELARKRREARRELKEPTLSA